MRLGELEAEAPPGPSPREPKRRGRSPGRAPGHRARVSPRLPVPQARRGEPLATRIIMIMMAARLPRRASESALRARRPAEPNLKTLAHCESRANVKLKRCGNLKHRDNSVARISGQKTRIIMAAAASGELASASDSGGLRDSGKPTRTLKRPFIKA
jgi:hypothetical protein